MGGSTNCRFETGGTVQRCPFITSRVQYDDSDHGGSGDGGVGNQSLAFVIELDQFGTVTLQREAMVNSFFNLFLRACMVFTVVRVVFLQYCTKGGRVRKKRLQFVEKGKNK